MLLFLPIFLLLLGLAAPGLIIRYRPEFRSFWLLNLSGPFLAWLGLLFLRPELPLRHSLSYWSLSTGPNLELLWQMDLISWTLIFAVSSLLLASQLSNIRDLEERSAFFWSPGILIAASAMLAIMAGNLLTLVITWTILDVLAASLLIREDQSPDSLRQTAVSFSANLFGSMLLLWAIAAYTSFPGLAINALPSQAHLPLILAPGIRLGVLPLNPFVLQERISPESPRALIVLLQTTASLALLVRMDTPLAEYTGGLLVLVLAAALYASAKWALAKDAQTALPYWLPALSALVVAAAVFGLEAASLSWSLVLILGGAFFAFSGLRRELLWPGILWAVFLLTGLPLGPNRAGITLFAASAAALSYAFLIPLSLLMLGWVQQARKNLQEEVIWQRWESAIYGAGLVLLVWIHFVLGTAIAPEASLSAQFLAAWPSLALLLLAGGFWLVRDQTLPLNSGQRTLLKETLSMRWIYRLGGGILRQLAALLRFLGGLLEGRAGVLWALLFVALLLSLITQLSPSG